MVIPAQNNARGGGRLSQLVARLLDRDFNREALPVLRAISRTTQSGIVARRMKELDDEVARLVAAGGKRLPPDNAVLKALVGDLEAAMRGNVLLVDGAAAGLQGSGIGAAPTVQRAAATAGLTPNVAAQVRAAMERARPGSRGARYSLCGQQRVGVATGGVRQGRAADDS